MIFKLAAKNLISKPWRTVATALAIAVAVAMIFTMLSFKSAVYDYIFSSETAVSGDSDLLISTNSSSDRITQVSDPLKNIEGVERVTPSLSLYATISANGAEEYVQVRGFEKGHVQDLQKVNVARFRPGISSVDDMLSDDAVISEAAAKHFGLDVGDRISLKLGSFNASFIIAAVADLDGYFLSDAPYLILGHIADGVARLLSNVGLSAICNEIYVKTQPGADIDSTIARIATLQEYSGMLIRRTGDNGYIIEQVNSLTAPVVLAGAAVLVLSVAIIVLLFMMTEQEKTSLIGRLRMVGATKRQLVAMFLSEGVIISASGALIGAGLAAGIYTLILKLTLSSAYAFKISAPMLALATAIGFIAAVVGSVIPTVRALSGSIRKNQLNISGSSRLSAVAAIALCAVCVVLLILELTGATGVMGTAYVGIVALVLSLAAIGLSATLILRLAAKGMKKAGSGYLKVAANDLVRSKRHSRAITLLSVGMSVSMLLFMAWSLTTNIFTSYVKDFEDMIFINNIRSSFDVDEFSEYDGVKFATKLVWKQGSLSGGDFEKTVNIIGTDDALELVDFEYITARSTVKERLLSDKNYVFVDYAVAELYGVNEGDTLRLSLDDKSAEVTVGGILKHRLFNGGYMIASDRILYSLFGVEADTALLISDGDIDDIVNSIRTQVADKNLYVLRTLDAYKWDMRSMFAVFDLVGTLAIVVASFILVVTVAATLVGRASENKSRTALLNAGMSKSMLLRSEVAEYATVALTAFAISVIASAPLTASLIYALRLFGLYFEFMYELWVTFVAGATMSLLYSLVPIAFCFKKRYNIKKEKFFE